MSGDKLHRAKEKYLEFLRTLPDDFTGPFMVTMKQGGTVAFDFVQKTHYIPHQVKQQPAASG